MVSNNEERVLRGLREGQHAQTGTFSSTGPINQPLEEGGIDLKDVGRKAAKKAEREAIRRMLEESRWNRRETADRLQISYKALLYKIKEYGLDE